MKELLGKPQTGFIERIRHKASSGFPEKLDAFILHIENRWFTPADVRLTNGFIIPGEFIEEQFRRFDRYPMPAGKTSRPKSTAACFTWPSPAPCTNYR